MRDRNPDARINQALNVLLKQWRWSAWDVERVLTEVFETAGRGAWAEAESLCRALLEHAPRHFKATVLLGDILARLNRPDEALAAYARAERFDPGNPPVFTRSAILRFRGSSDLDRHRGLRTNARAYR